MTLEEKLVALIKPICARVKPDFAPVNTELPYVTFQQVGGQAPDFLDGSVPNLENAEVQINIWAKSRLEAKAMMMQIEVTLIQATSIQAGPVGACVADFDYDMERYGARQDFNIWADR